MNKEELGHMIEELRKELQRTDIAESERSLLHMAYLALTKLYLRRHGGGITL